MPTAYNKPFKTVPEQIELLRSRGMSFANEDAAIRCLQNVGYYRLSGYWYPDRVRVPIPTTDPKQLPASMALSTFKPGTSFERAHQVYEFDRKLKLLVLDGLERLEVAMRFQLGHTLGEGHPYAHCDTNTLSSAFTGIADPTDPLDRAAWLSSEHSKWLLKVRRQEDNSKEEFVKHFKRRYGHGLPVWVITEILDFGGMSTLYSGLKQSHRDQIAELFGFEKDGRGDGPTLASWMTNLNYIRNTCAHHARLWNKNMAVQGSDLSHIPDLLHADQSKDRLYASLAVVSYLLLHIDPHASWREDIKTFVQENSSLGDPDKMGFPAGWDQERLWDASYQPQVDPELARRRKIRNKFECLGTSELGRVLAPLESRKDAANLVRRLRFESKLIALQVEQGAPAHFPAFQLEAETASVSTIVAYANVRLNAKTNPWEAAEWWTKGNHLLAGRTPLQDLESGTLTTLVIDQMLN